MLNRLQPRARAGLSSVVRRLYVVASWAMLIATTVAAGIGVVLLAATVLHALLA